MTTSQTVVHNEVETDHDVEQGDNEAWKNKRLEWENTMWQDIGNAKI
jgi:hypothetical protein